MMLHYHYHYFTVLLRSHLLWLSLSLCMDLTDSYGLINNMNKIGANNLQSDFLINNKKLPINSALSLPIQNRMDDTIDEVQKILHRDPTLPRLTRGEIQELYEKVIREELEKNVKVSDKSRAEHMRALMLVLPFNTDNTTEENLHELFTRPPITKVVETDITHEPLQYITPWKGNKSITRDIGIMDATTYKPNYTIKTSHTISEPSPTTYHPKRPAIKLTINNDNDIIPFKPINIEKPQLTKTLQRFSSHYNAKNTDFIQKQNVPRNQGVSFNVPSKLDEYDISESAPKPVYNAYFPQTVSSIADMKGAGAQSLTAHIKPDAYMKFKPLNIGEEIPVKPEVEDYLTRFGIVRGRKRKDLERNIKHRDKEFVNEQIEQVSLGSEKTIKKLPLTSNVKSRKDGSVVENVPTNSELDKLLKNLRELEKLNIKPKINIKSATTATPTTITSATSTTAAAVTTKTTSYAPLINQGTPKLIEAKKPRRRIDPNIDVNFDSNGNRQIPSDTHNNNEDDQLSKLLQNLQELEKLQIDPQHILKTMVSQAPKVRTSNKPQPVVTATTSVPITPKVIPKQSAVNRFNSQQSNSRTQQNRQQQQLQQQKRQQQQQQQKRQQQQQLSLLQQQTQKASTQTQPDLQQLQRLLLQLQRQEKATTTTARPPPTTTSTIRAPITKKSTAQAPVVPNDLLQLRRLLTNDEELEKLFQQAKARQQQQQQQQRQQQKVNSKSKIPAATTTTTTTTTTTSTTRKPSIDLQKQQQQQQRLTDLGDLSQLQLLLAQIERQQQLQRLAAKAAAATTTTTTTTEPPPPPLPLPPLITTPATTTTTSRPLLPVVATATTTPTTVTRADWQDSQNKKPHINNEQLEALINRVQQLEKLNHQQRQHQQQLQLQLKQQQELQQHRQPQFPIPTDTPLTDILGFTTRNVKDPVVAIEKQYHSLPMNDFANLRTLYKQQLQNGNEQLNQNQNRNREGEVEISTAATTVKIQKQTAAATTASNNRVQQFAERIIDITNDTGTGSSLTHVDPREFVQLQKLLSKVQELERVKITIPTTATTTTTTAKPISTIFDLNRDNDFDRSNNMLKITTTTQFNQNHLQKANNLHVVYAAKETTTTTTTNNNNNNNHNNSNSKTIIPKTTTTTTTTTDTAITTSKMKEEDSTELEKLLSNAKELQKLGIKLPDLTTKNTSESSSTTTTTTTTTMANTLEPNKNSNDRTVVFSLTTVKSTFPRPTKPSTTTTESSIQLPVFSATKIIEDAIIRAANKIGVSTELPQRRFDNNINDIIIMEEMINGKQRKKKGQENIEKYEEDFEQQHTSNVDDLLASFSEIDEAIVAPPDDMNINMNSSLPNSENNENDNVEDEIEKQKYLDLRDNLPELKRLIKNLQELQKLNLSSNPALLRRVDQEYLQQKQQQQNLTEQQDKEVSRKTRRQSLITEAPSNSNPTRVQLNLDLSESERSSSTAPTSTTTTTTPSTTTTTTTTEQSRSANLRDLEASFGPDPNRQDTLPPPPPQKKNGFYFMADWNSFLEVGDGDDQVIVRFSPKIGDPRSFIPVKIP